MIAMIVLAFAASIILAPVIGVLSTIVMVVLALIIEEGFYSAN